LVLSRTCDFSGLHAQIVREKALDYQLPTGDFKAREHSADALAFRGKWLHPHTTVNAGKRNMGYFNREYLKHPSHRFVLAVKLRSNAVLLVQDLSTYSGLPPSRRHYYKVGATGRREQDFTVCHSYYEGRSSFYQIDNTATGAGMSVVVLGKSGECTRLSGGSAYQDTALQMPLLRFFMF
jgi:hypothetical protein